VIRNPLKVFIVMPLHFMYSDRLYKRWLAKSAAYYGQLKFLCSHRLHIICYDLQAQLNEILYNIRLPRGSTHQMLFEMLTRESFMCIFLSFVYCNILTLYAVDLFYLKLYIIFYSNVWSHIPVFYTWKSIKWTN